MEYAEFTVSLVSERHAAIYCTGGETSILQGAAEKPTEACGLVSLMDRRLSRTGSSCIAVLRPPLPSRSWPGAEGRRSRGTRELFTRKASTFSVWCQLCVISRRRLPLQDLIVARTTTYDTNETSW